MGSYAQKKALQEEVFNPRKKLLRTCYLNKIRQEQDWVEGKKAKPRS